MEEIGRVGENGRTARPVCNLVPVLCKLRWQRRSRLVRHLPHVGMPAERKYPHRSSIVFRAPCWRDGREESRLLVDKPPDRPSTQQFRQLASKIVQRGGVGQVAEWVWW